MTSIAYGLKSPIGDKSSQQQISHKSVSQFSINRKDKQTVALVDWRWQGHHSNYFVNYVVAIAKAGYRVLPLCSNPGDFSSRLAILLSSGSSHELETLIDDPIHLSHPKSSKIRPARYRGWHNAWRRFAGLGKQLRHLEKTKEINVSMEESDNNKFCLSALSPLFLRLRAKICLLGTHGRSSLFFSFLFFLFCSNHFI